MTFRVGIGYDIHRLEKGDGIILANVRIPCPYRIVAHSDGDVVLHAICDALLGAAAAGDLGEHFPDDDQAHAGRDSAEFVAEVLGFDALKPWKLVNVDVNVVAQAPRLGPHKGTMRIRLAELLGIPLDCVGLKARTNEGCDAVGELRAIQAQAVVLLQRRRNNPGTAVLQRHRRIATPAAARGTTKTGRQRSGQREGQRGGQQGGKLSDLPP